MDIVTKMQVNVSSDQVFEAFVNPDYIGGFWFSSSSERWEEGKTITLRYEEYHAEIDILIEDMVENEMIQFKGGDNHVTIQFDGDDNHTIVTTTEKDIEENDVARLLGQKEGWVYMLSCLKSYLEYGNKIRGALL
ncbi:hypothetical protein BUY27_05655 [Staphylococcus cohnii]|uniref:SRPBCC domain-containing protein n=1 Tax=Staphylococcus TaxID=1279 RepID=UPI0006199E56|nr:MULTISPECIES: SRPBCC domain-containing protein [unclassified Staphylococcus]KKD24757.1 hypothetical protein XA21_00465 [Staphylococcus cohnii subsp. cohnii]KKD25312.1 hypothetical protein XA22_03385 [Staphylococcus cohnii subsp. cohnii]PUZ34833.1 hypothetical protein BUY27_05655 [Staphylococcus cohnii]